MRHYDAYDRKKIWYGTTLQVNFHSFLFVIMKFWMSVSFAIVTTICAVAIRVALLIIEIELFYVVDYR